MKRDELRETQRPQKERYREDPASARLTLRAAGELGSEAVSCSVETGRALVVAGLHPASGGDGALACSGDMLLQALVACAGVTLGSVAVNRGLEVGGRVVAEGDLDFRGTMGVASTARHRSASPGSACASSSTPTRATRSWTGCSRPPSATASSTRPSQVACR